MFRTLVRRLLLVSILPLLVIAVANFLLFYFLNRSIVIEQHANSLRGHREAIEAFLGELTAELDTVARQYTLAELLTGNLDRVFPVIKKQAGVFTDIGIIDAAGNHLKYLGPYALSDKNYRGTEWFARVVEEGTFISDIFLGFRAVPHFVIAVKRPEGGSFWILRATVNTDYFSKLVDATYAGRTGETFILNREGLYQTQTRFAGKLLEPSGYPDLEPHEDIRGHELRIGDKRYLSTTTWLRNPRWLLVFRQELWDVFAPLRRSILVGVAVCAAGVIGAAVLAVVVARYQVRRIATADREKEALTQQLVAAGKTAAVGEMSAGLAHEINNPLATIDVLQTWIRDLAGADAIPPEDRLEIIDSANKIGTQVERCKVITQGLLKFARKVESRPAQVDLRGLIEELVAVLRTRARVEGTDLQADLAEVPPLHASPSHLQQVIVNLVNNALDAVAGRADPTVTIRTRLLDGKVRIEVSDNGCGIAQEHLSSIFLPFFTSKPAGRGTGLGLSICYGLVRELGGSIEVESQVDVGTTFVVMVPVGSQPAGAERAT
jgi:two-component system NtrC family sensor kinase